jgi:hypothetical protein
MPVTRYYPSVLNSSPGSNEPSGEQSALFPWGTEQTTYTDSPDYVELNEVAPSATAQLTTTFNSINQTARQSAFLGHAFYRLGTQTIPAGTWSFAAVGGETNLAANSFFAVSIYVWRPSNSTVVGSIYDSQTELGTEWSTAATSRLFTVSGSSLATLNGDTLIVEFWYTAAQGMGTSYAQSVFFGANVANSDFTANGQTNLNSWIDSPDTLVAFIPAQTPKSYGFIFD